MSEQILKIGAVLLDGHGRLLVVEKEGRGVFIIPGGRQESGETDADTLLREVQEELGLIATADEFLGELSEPAAFEDARLRMRVYIASWTGVPVPAAEITAFRWVGRVTDIALGSALANHVIPWLFERGLIDG